MLKRQHTAIVGILLVGAMVSPLSAQCGFVLWMQLVNEKGASSTWDAIDGFSDEPSCRVSLRDELDSYVAIERKKTPGKPVQSGARSVFIERPDGTRMINFACFPATTDPRSRP